MKNEVPGWFGESDGEVYRNLAGRFSDAVIIEVGAWHGRSAAFLAPVARDRKSIVYCVDHWKGKHLGDGPAEKNYGSFLRNLSALGYLGNPIHPVWVESVVAAEWFLKRGIKADFIFIDADHDYESVREDVIAWSKLLKPEGIIAGHDYTPSFPGVAKAAHELSDEVHANDLNSAIWWSPARKLKIP